MRKGNNKGSASVYLICLLIPTMICMVMLIKYAQMISAKGMAADAKGLGDNAVRASYNHVIMDNYGLFCYTKSDSELTRIGNYYVNKSLPGNISCQITASKVPGTNLNDNEFLLEQIDYYMQAWNETADEADIYQLCMYEEMLRDASDVRETIEEHYNDVISNGETDSIELADEEAEFRSKHVFNTNTDNIILDFDQVDLNYGAASTNGIPACNRIISRENDILDNVKVGIDIIKNVEDYNIYLDDAIDSTRDNNQKHSLALYVYNNSSAFNAFGCTTITGRTRTDGDMKSVCAWTENEFIINGTNDSINNADKVKYMIYESLFTEYMTDIYYSFYDHDTVEIYALLIAGENEEYVPVIKDELIISYCARLAWNEVIEVYNNSATGIFTCYPDYVCLFDKIEVERNCDEVLNRLKYIIELNAANSSNAEAREFSFANAYTEAVSE